MTNINYRPYKQSPVWVKYIHRRIKANKNFLNVTSGKTGSGKSYSILAVCEMLNKDFDVDRVVFRAKDLMKIINDDKYKNRKGVAILWDEAGIDLNNKNWQSRVNKVLNYLIQTFRHRNFILFFTSPHADFIDSATRKMFHGQFETLSIDKQKKLVRIKPLQIDYNSSMKKYYRKYLIVNGKKVKRWDVPMPSPDLVTAYEQKKTDFTRALNKDILEELEEQEPEIIVNPVEISIENGTIIDDVMYWNGHEIKDTAQILLMQLWRNGIIKYDDIVEEMGLSKEKVSSIMGQLKKSYNIISSQVIPKTKNPFLPKVAKWTERLQVAIPN